MNYIDDIAHLLPNAAGFSAGKLTHAVSEVTEADDAAAAVETFARRGVEGWVQTTDALLEWSSSVDLSHPILCAELAAKDASLHVRRTADAWVLNEIRRETSDDDVIAKVEYRGRAPFPRLRYEVQWELVSGPDGFERYATTAARFVGFATGDE